MTELLYYLDFGASACNYSVHVNDIPVFKHNAGQSTRLEIPINPFLLSGVNRIKVILLPAPGRSVFDEDVEAAVFLLNRYNGEKDKTEIASVKTPYFDKAHNLPAFTMHLEAEVFPTFNSVIWKANKLANSEAVLQKLNKEYEEIYQLMAKKQLEPIMTKVKMREREMADSLFEPYSVWVEGTRECFSDDFMDSQLQLLPIHFSLLQLKTYADGRMICLEDANGKSPICYHNAELSQKTYYPFYFIQPAGSEELVIIR